MMKREWPQQWPSLLEELHALSKRGPTQTELVLFVFMRIAEDVATLQVRKLHSVFQMCVICEALFRVL